MEVQMTDFENAAVTVFVVLITRVVLSFDLALYIPLSKVDENMRRAHEKGAVVANKFFFRKHVAPPEVEEGVAISRAGSSAELSEFVPSSPPTNRTSHCVSPSSSPIIPSSPAASPLTLPTPPGSGSGRGAASLASSSFDEEGKSKEEHPPLPSEDSFEEMTTEEIFHGKGVYYPGLIPLVYAYLDYINCDKETYSRVDQYIQFISKRAKGELMTPATWIRSFVAHHPAYKNDSIITDEIAHDLMIACRDIGEGSRPCPEMLGNIQIEKVRAEDAYGSLLAGKLSYNERSLLVQRLLSRAAQVSAGSPRGSVTAPTFRPLDFEAWSS
jgi:glutamate--cysteine ligase catalytic subunit